MARRSSSNPKPNTAPKKSVKTKSASSLSQSLETLRSIAPSPKRRGWVANVSEEDLETIKDLVRALYRGELPEYTGVEALRRKIVEAKLFEGFTSESPGEQGFRQFARKVHVEDQ